MVEAHETLSSLAETPASDVISDNGYASPYNYGDLYEDEKCRRKFLKKCVMQCRQSTEYKRYRSFLVENLNLDKCSILSNLSADDIHGTLEIHHYPFTLYDICDIVLSKFLADEDSVTTFRVSNKVMEYHWKNMVGLIPLSKTMHEAAHDSQLKLHPSMIFGQWYKFIKDNIDYLSEDILARFKTQIREWDNVIANGVDLDNFDIQITEWSELNITIQDLLTPKVNLEIIDESTNAE